jgi:hypothetical protein
MRAYNIQEPIAAGERRTRAMVARSEQAWLAMAQGNAPKEATVKILEYKEMEPFFVKGESDEP